jgi:hypothetical protein
MGRSWVALMAIVALSSFFIWTIRTVWLFSPIHLLSIFVLAMLWRGVSAIRRGDASRHGRTMEYTFFLGLVITGLLTFLPGRIMSQVAFGADGPTPAKLTVFGGTVLVAAAIGAGIWLWRRRRARLPAQSA